MKIKKKFSTKPQQKKNLKNSEKIIRFNQPNCKMNKTERKNEKSASTTKMRNFAASRAFEHNKEAMAKSMPEIQTKNAQTFIKKKSHLTKLPKLWNSHLPIFLLYSYYFHKKLIISIFRIKMIWDGADSNRGWTD